MTTVMAGFGFIKNPKTSDFEKWLSDHGYYYIKTKDNRPCFKSKLTCKLKQHYQTEMKSSKSKIFSFKSKG